MKTTIEWHKCSEKLPEKSGKYLYWYLAEGIMDVSFSVKHQRWNAYDHMDEEQLKDRAFKIEGPEYWAEIPDLGEGE